MSSRNKRGLSEHATFSFNPEDRERIETLRARLGRQGHLLNRSEVVRLGLLVLAGQSGPSIDSGIVQLKRLRPGRVPRVKADRR